MCWWRAIWSKICISANKNPKIATAAPYRGRRGRDMDVGEVHFWSKTCFSASWNPQIDTLRWLSDPFGTQFIINSYLIKRDNSLWMLFSALPRKSEPELWPERENEDPGARANDSREHTLKQTCGDIWWRDVMWWCTVWGCKIIK